MARGTPIATDGFTNVANFTQLNPLYANMTATSGVVHGTTAQNDSGGVQAAVWSGAGTFSADHYASLVVGGLYGFTTAYSIGVIVRATTDTDSARDYYQFIVCADGGSTTGTSILSKVVNGTRTLLHSAVLTWANGDRIELEAEGTTIRACKNGTALGGSFTVTDSALSTGKPGIAGAGQSGVIWGDNFEAGDMVAEVVTLDPITACYPL